MPGEHGGWGLTLEPVLLGLLLAPSWAGLCIAVAAFLAFLARTPLKLALVDRHRQRWLDRSRLAAGVAATELAAMAALVALATALAGFRWWAMVAVAVPLVAVELWYDARSRGRRLIPELCGAIGVAAAAAAIVVAGDGGTALAVAAWLVLAARAIGSIPCVRTQIRRVRRGAADTTGSDLAQLASVAVAIVAVVVHRDTVAGAAVVGAIAVLQLIWSRRTPTSVKAVGLTQMALGLTVVAVTAGGAALA
jgi:hypothetical protein